MRYFIQGILLYVATCWGYVLDNKNTWDEGFAQEFVNSPSIIQHSHDFLTLNATAFGQDYTINLKKASNIFHDDFNFLSLELDDDNQVVLKNVALDVPTSNIFKNDNQGSVLHISNNNGNFQAEGILTPDISLHTHENIQHSAVKSKVNEQRKNEKSFFPNIPKKFSTNKVRREIPDLVTPEVLVIVDYKHAKTLQFSNERIMKYLAVFWNAVNLRYATITEPKIKLSIVSAIIIKEQNLQPYMEKGRFTADRKVYIDYMESLPNMAQYMYANGDKYPKHDFAMVMTGEDLAGKDDDGTVDSTYTGIAIVGGACTFDKENNMTLAVGIAEDVPPFYDGVLYHAHEAAHLLGAVHDGDEPAEHLPGSPGAEACPFKDGYLMSYKLGTGNHVRWSKCTVEQIRWYLGTAQAECLLSKESTKWPMQLSNTLPGVLVGIDQQCHHAGRKNPRAFPGDKTTICSALYCTSDDFFSTVTSIGPALEGTSCGYTVDRWCINGECVRKD